MSTPQSIQFSLTNTYSVPGTPNIVKPAQTFIPLTFDGAKGIIVEVDGVVSTDWVYQAATNTITFTGEIETNNLPVIMTVSPQTDTEDGDTDLPQTFNAGSAIRAEDLNLMLAKIKELENTES